MAAKNGWNHSGKDLQDHRVQTSTEYPQTPSVISQKTTSAHCLNTPRNGLNISTSTSPFRCLTTPPVKKSFLISNLNPPGATWGQNIGLIYAPNSSQPWFQTVQKNSRPEITPTNQPPKNRSFPKSPSQFNLTKIQLGDAKIGTAEHIKRPGGNNQEQPLSQKERLDPKTLPVLPRKCQQGAIRDLQIFPRWLNWGWAFPDSRTIHVINTLEFISWSAKTKPTEVCSTQTQWVGNTTPK